MGRIFFACPVVAEAGHPDRFQPKIDEVKNGPTGYFPSVWETTDGGRAEPWAVGAAEVTAAQLVAIEAETLIIAIDEPRWTQRFDEQIATGRTRINQFCDRIGVSRPRANEVLRDFVHRLIGVLSTKGAEDVLA